MWEEKKSIFNKRKNYPRSIYFGEKNRSQAKITFVDSQIVILKAKNKTKQPPQI